MTAKQARETADQVNLQMVLDGITNAAGNGKYCADIRTDLNSRMAITKELKLLQYDFEIDKEGIVRIVW